MGPNRYVVFSVMLLDLIVGLVSIALMSSLTPFLIGYAGFLVGGVYAAIPSLLLMLLLTISFASSTIYMLDHKGFLVFGRMGSIARFAFAEANPYEILRWQVIYWKENPGVIWKLISGIAGFGLLLCMLINALLALEMMETGEPRTAFVLLVFIFTVYFQYAALDSSYLVLCYRGNRRVAGYGFATALFPPDQAQANVYYPETRETCALAFASIGALVGCSLFAVATLFLFAEGGKEVRFYCLLFAGIVCFGSRIAHKIIAIRQRGV